ncbi:protein kinase domain-containing protein [Rhodopirellula europaea]|uniref:protein kinase domain-containing protein n=1 Tax=Rhodopirellula europaea TaxID=1263866 RepID=UPI003D27E85F
MSKPPIDSSNGNRWEVGLQIIAGPHRGDSWSFDIEQSVRIGRSEPSHLRLPNEMTLSRQHLELVIHRGWIEMKDLGSSNGTKVNGLRMTAATLRDGDTFQVGKTEVRVTIQDVVGHESTDSDLDAESTQLTPRLISPSEPHVAFASTAKSAEHEHEATRISPHGRTVDPTQNTETPPAILASRSEVKGKILETRAPDSTDDEEFESTLLGTNVPSSVGPYALLRKLGEGGMASVYLAEHRRTGEQYAIKLIRSDLPANGKQNSLFLREAGVLTRLDHPRIVKSVEFGLEGETPYLVMQFIKTLDLLELLDSKPLEERIKIATWTVFCVLQALHYAHSQGIVHRDIKPGNLLAYRQGRHLRVKLADFGLAKCYEDAGLSQMTNDKSVRGTLAYMAPEQFHNSRDAGPESDLFACGACLYRLAVNRIPNMLLKPAETLQELAKCSELPSDLQAVIGKSIAIPQEQRFKSPQEFAEALRPFHAK